MNENNRQKAKLIVPKINLNSVKMAFPIKINYNSNQSKGFNSARKNPTAFNCKKTSRKDLLSCYDKVLREKSYEGHNFSNFRTGVMPPRKINNMILKSAIKNSDIQTSRTRNNFNLNLTGFSSKTSINSKSRVVLNNPIEGSTSRSHKKSYSNINFMGKINELKIKNENLQNTHKTNLKILNMNINTPAMRKLKVDYLIKQQLDKEKIEEKLIKKMEAKINILSDELLEIKDEVIFDNLEIEKQKEFIRNFLRSKQNKLNQTQENSKLFVSFENKVNFFDDIFIVPHIKNKIFSNEVSTSTNSNENSGMPSVVESEELFRNKNLEYLQCQNSLEKPVQQYLNSLKYKFQKEKDNYENKLKKEKQEEQKESISNIYKKTTEKKNATLSYEHSDYLVFKYERYAKVDFADEKIKEIVNREIISENKYKKGKMMFGGLIEGLVKKFVTIQEETNNIKR